MISQAVLQGANTRKKGLLLESASRNRNGAKAVIKNTFSLLVFSLLYSEGFEPGSDSLLYADFFYFARRLCILQNRQNTYLIPSIRCLKSAIP